MRELALLLLWHHDRPRTFVSIPVSVCRVLSALLGLCMKRPPLTSSAIAGIVNDANLDPTEAIQDLGYAPIGVRAGFQMCFPRCAESLGAPSPTAMSIAKGQLP